MLTSDLIRVKVSKGRVIPRYLSEDHPGAKERAELLTTLYNTSIDRPRGEIEEDVAEAVGDGTDFLIWRGLAKLLDDRSEYETVAEADPIEIRRVVFELAHELGPVSSEAHRQEILARAAETMQLHADAIERGLYADLLERQRLTSHRSLTPLGLLRRYNVALAQAALYRATRMVVDLRDEDPNLLRYLFQCMKFFRLMHRAWRTDEGWRLELDGPASLFSKSRKYGLQMSMFLPALALAEDWSLVAELDWAGDGTTHTLEVGSDDGLVSHYNPKGQWIAEEEEYFEQKFAKKERAWRLERRGSVLELDRGEVLIPDYVMTHVEDGREVFVEVVGFWRRAYLERRLELLEHLDAPVVLVVSERLRSDRGKLEFLESAPPAVVFFKGVILVDRVIEAAERISGGDAAQAS